MSKGAYDFDTQYEEPTERPRPAPGEVTNEEQATQAVDAINTAEERLERVKKQAKAWIKQAELDLKDVLYQWEEPVKQWHLENPPDDGRKSRILSSGTIRQQSKKDSVFVQHEEDMKQWCRDNAPQLITKKVSEKFPTKTTLTAYCESTGEVPGGCTIKPAYESVTIGRPK